MLVPLVMMISCPGNTAVYTPFKDNRQKFEVIIIAHGHEYYYHVASKDQQEFKNCDVRAVLHSYNVFC